MPLARKSLVFVTVLLTLCAAAAWAAPSAGTLRVGAARVDITPPLLPMENGQPETLGSHLYVRAIVIDNGTARAALVNADQGGLHGDIWADGSKRIAAELNCPVSNILLSATHIHSDGGTFALGYAFLGPSGPKPPAAKYPNIADAMVEAVKEAKAKLQPAVVGYDTEPVYLNVNRDAVSPITHRWYQGPDTAAPSDKTLAVLTFQSPEGKPIAIYMNYAMHPINYYLTGVLSADFPGVAETTLESTFPGAVAMFTQGASGDQNPLYLGPFVQMHQALDGEQPSNIGMAEHEAKSNAQPAMPAWTPTAAKLSAQAVKPLNAWVQAEGLVVAHAAMRAMRRTDNFTADPAIWSAQTMLTCPGRIRTNTGRQGYPGTYKDGPPVDIRLGLLRIGRFALGTVDAEVYNEIAIRLKAESPFNEAMMVTLTNGAANSGYIPNDASFTHNTFQVLSSRLKPGCAEDGIVNGILGMMSKSLQ